jgi:hypothetical protein
MVAAILGLIVLFLAGIFLVIYSNKYVDFREWMWELIAQVLDGNAKEPHILPLVKSFNSRHRKINIWITRGFGIFFAIAAFVLSLVLLVVATAL